MKTKDLDRDSTIALIEIYKKRIEFNNKLNRLVRKKMKEWHLENNFNGFRDAPTSEMREILTSLVNEETWMSEKLKNKYLQSVSEIFGQVYGPHVNRYVLSDLHDLENHLAELESASKVRREENSEFRVERDLSSNRMNLYFDSIPELEIRNLLKRNGFRWSPYLQAWTRQLTQQAEKSLEQLKKELGL